MIGRRWVVVAGAALGVALVCGGAGTAAKTRAAASQTFTVNVDGTPRKRERGLRRVLPAGDHDPRG